MASGPFMLGDFLLGPGMHGELIAELSSTTQALAAGASHSPPVTRPNF